MVPRGPEVLKQLRAPRTYRPVCNIDLILVLFLLSSALLRNVVYVKKNYFFAQLAPKQRKLERYVERGLLHLITLFTAKFYKHFRQF